MQTLTSRDLGQELTLNLQWQINRHFFLLGIVSAAFPGEAIRSLPESQGPWLSGQLALFYNF